MLPDLTWTRRLRSHPFGTAAALSAKVRSSCRTRRLRSHPLVTQADWYGRRLARRSAVTGLVGGHGGGAGVGGGDVGGAEEGDEGESGEAHDDGGHNERRA